VLSPLPEGAADRGPIKMKPNQRHAKKRENEPNGNSGIEPDRAAQLPRTLFDLQDRLVTKKRENEPNARKMKIEPTLGGLNATRLADSP
jgi:hypothetical protein